MNNSNPEGTPTSAGELSRGEKVTLLQQMYTRAHWIELIRIFGYQTLLMSQAKEAIKPLAERYGKEPLAAACEALVEISTQDKEPTARLKPHVRRMAVQILGFEPTPETLAETSADTTTAPALQSETTRPPKIPRAKRETKAVPPVAPVATPSTVSSGVGGTVIERYRAAKERHPDMLLLFRMGDFYELFAEDAEIAHKLLGLTLTTRDRMIAMAGFPHHQLEAYLHTLLKAGQRVAVCDPVDESDASGPRRRPSTSVLPSVPVSEPSETLRLTRTRKATLAEVKPRKKAAARKKHD